ncbi:MAG: PfkB family carbohydrate kinase, partial [Armatimonadota bacterium]
GDVMLDEYLMGETRRISPEAPVLVVDVQDMRWAPGGAANVAANVRALGGEVSIVGVTGCDEAGRRLAEQLEALGVQTDGLVQDPHTCTTLKTRIIAANQQVVRVDREKREHPDGRVLKRLRERIANALPGVDAVVASDYDKGVIGQITQEAIALARQKGVVFTSNPKPRNLRWFRGADLITLNQVEAEAAGGVEIHDESAVEKAGSRILKRTGAGNVIITRGAHGMSVFQEGGAVEHIPVMPVEVFDVAGAGDTVVSTLTLALAAGADIVTAARLANFAGASVVRKLGVQTAVPSEIAHLIRQARENGL